MTATSHLRAENAKATTAPQDSEQAPELSTREVVGSVLAAGLGVQSRENKVRDFNRGKPLQFIVAGLVFTLGLLGALVAVVNLVV
jgi:hypothetical protein